MASAAYLAPHCAALPGFRFSQLRPPPPNIGRQPPTPPPLTASEAGGSAAGNFHFAPSARPHRHAWRFPAGLHDQSSTVVTQSTWDELVLKSEIPVLVVFWASWCGPCKMVDRVIDEIIVEYANMIKFFRLDADVNFQVAADYGVESVPTILLFKNGKKMEFIVGTMPKEIYEAAIKRTLANDNKMV